MFRSIKWTFSSGEFHDTAPSTLYVPVIPKSPMPPVQKPKAFDFFETFKFPCDVGSPGDQMPHQLTLQKASIPLPIRY